MANMAEGLAFVSKTMIMEVLFHPDRDISSHSAVDITSEMLAKSTRIFVLAFWTFVVLEFNVDLKMHMFDAVRRMLMQ